MATPSAEKYPFSVPFISRYHRKKPSFWKKLERSTYDFLINTNWRHVGFKAFAYSYIAVILVFIWLVSPLSGIWTRTDRSDRIPMLHQDLENYFSGYDGYSHCGLNALQLYQPPLENSAGYIPRNWYCSRRAQLLEAMSTGGRLGFDAPYTPRGCHYRWYDVSEICMILERFDALVFIGDSTLQSIYSGLNILLLQDLSLGALKTWDMKDEERNECMCENQFVKESCAKHFATSSEDVIHNFGGKHRSSYACQRTPHAFLSVNSHPAPGNALELFNKLVPRAPSSNYKSIPIIHSLTLPNSVPLASESLTEFLNLADATKRKTPMLWIGPPAAGHIEIKGRKGNQEIWQFASDMEKIAREKDVEVLGVWNMTVQASSWDGLRFGEKVALTQAMMVINWLSRLESS